MKKNLLWVALAALGLFAAAFELGRRRPKAA